MCCCMFFGPISPPLRFRLYKKTVHANARNSGICTDGHSLTRGTTMLWSLCAISGAPEQVLRNFFKMRCACHRSLLRENEDRIPHLRFSEVYHTYFLGFDLGLASSAEVVYATLDLSETGMPCSSWILCRCAVSFEEMSSICSYPFFHMIHAFF